MPNVLAKLTIREVSGVDRGAGEGVRVMLMKSAGGEARHFDMDGVKAADLAKALNDNAPMIQKAILDHLAKMETEADAIDKRNFTADQRRSAASEGAAMPDGSFPIKTVDDLHNAVRLVGHAKDPSAAKKHILARAKAIGASGELPAGWVGKNLSPFKKLLEKLGVNKQEDELEKGLGAFHQSVCTILCSDSVNKQELIEKSVGQFAKYVLGTTPENLADAMAAAGLIAEVHKELSGDDINKGDGDMNAEDLKKALGEALAPITKTVGDLQGQVAFMKLSPEHQAYCIKKGMTDEQKKAFAGKSKEECDDEMKKDAKKDEDDKGNPFAKRMSDVEKSAEEIQKDNKNLREELAKRDENDAIAVIAKRIEPIGGTVELAKSLHNMAKVDKDGAALIEKQLAANFVQIDKGNLFRVVGVDKSRDAGDPVGAMTLLVDSVMKAANDSGKPMTRNQAIAKISESRDAEHQKVWKAYKAASGPNAAAA